MTLIAQLSVNGAPFLIGDVLLSSETRKGLKANLPLVGDINQILAERGAPFEVSFVQKLNLFNGRIAVAWSGPLIQAERALRIIAQMSIRPDVTADRIISELEAVERSAIDQLQLIGLVLEEVTSTTATSSLFSIRVPPVSLDNIGNVFAAGSGRDAFFQLLGRANWLSSGAIAYHVAHGLLAALTNEEFRTGNTIFNRWGGGFEALTYSPASACFEKIGDILHTFWAVSEIAGDTIGFLPFFYKTTYWRDALVLRTASLEGAKLKTNDINLIPPLLNDIADYNLADLGSVDFSYRAVCCHVLIEKAAGRDLLLVVDQREARQDVLFTLDGSRGELHISDYLPSIIREQLELTSNFGHGH
jgi:hypothetical protein